jgi:hypothetical protein
MCCVYTQMVARQCLGNMFSRQRIHATIEELLDTLFPMHSVSYREKMGDKSFPELFVFTKQ